MQLSLGPIRTSKTHSFSAAVINHLNDICRRDLIQPRGVAYFYITHAGRTSILAIVLALLRQLFLQLPTLATEIEGFEHSELQEKEYQDILAKAFRALAAIVCRFRQCYVVLDGLDECAMEHREDLKDLVDVLWTSRSRLYLTARPTEWGDELCAKAIHIDVESRSQDARSHFEQSLDSIASSQLLSRERQEDFRLLKRKSFPAGYVLM